jgi:hypothetical protein
VLGNLRRKDVANFTVRSFITCRMLFNKYYWGIKSMRMRTGHIARMGEMRNVYKILVVKKPLGRTRRKWR